jgi:hypothetical protein
MVVILMHSKTEWIANLAEQTLTIEYQSGGITRVDPGHTTGWRTLPGTVTAFLRDYDSALYRPNRPDVRIRSGEAACVPQGQRHRFDLARLSQILVELRKVAGGIWGIIEEFDEAEGARACVETYPVDSGQKAVRYCGHVSEGEHPNQGRQATRLLLGQRERADRPPHDSEDDAASG